MTTKDSERRIWRPSTQGFFFFVFVEFHYTNSLTKGFDNQLPDKNDPFSTSYSMSFYSLTTSLASCNKLLHSSMPNVILPSILNYFCNLIYCVNPSNLPFFNKSTTNYIIKMLNDIHSFFTR